jgi:hypothetical protein
MITVYTRSINNELYAMMRSLIPNDVVCVKKTGYNTWEGALSFITDTIKECEGFAVIMDEDMFIHDWPAIVGIVNHMIEHGYTHAGVADRGIIPHRTLQWTTLNPFFNILNCDELRKRGSLNNIHRPANMVAPLFEIFDDFYIHLYKIGHPLFLGAATRSDSITTHVKDHNGNFIGLHSWYSREFNNNNGHKQRILKVFEDAKSYVV